MQCENDLPVTVAEGVFKTFEDKEPSFCQTAGAGPTNNPWALCSDKCLFPDCTPKTFQDDDGEKALKACVSLASPCVFPFKFHGTEYSNCTSDGSADTSSLWCAIAVGQDNEMIEGMWGVCDKYYESRGNDLQSF